MAVRTTALAIVLVAWTALATSCGADSPRGTARPIALATAVTSPTATTAASGSPTGIATNTPTEAATAPVSIESATPVPTNPATVAPTAQPSTAVPPPPPPPTPTPSGPPPATITLTANGLLFDRTEIRVRAGTRFTANMNNVDTGVEHNLTFGLPGIGHPTCTGPCTTTQTFTAAPAGRYSFLCTIHASMFGDFIVDP